MDTFNLKIFNTEKIFFSGEASYINILSDEGYIGILAHHAPLVSNILAGNILIKDKTDAETNLLISSNGFMEIIDNKVTIFVY
jgi:F-type H+-transporting ATPase subunit epsilon